jgi:hypothetical protein
VRDTTLLEKPYFLLPNFGEGIVLTIAFIMGVFIFLFFPTDSVDWRDTFFPVSKFPSNPYAIKSFINPPWLGIILFPLHYFSLNISQAINNSLNLIIIGLLVKYKKGNLLSLLLTLTSVPFLSLIANGNVEWIPAIGFFLQNGFGFLLLLTKPQSGIIAGIDWFLRSKNKYIFSIPAIFVIVISIVFWRNWPYELLSNVDYVKNLPFGLSAWNISFFPWSVPIGLGLIFIIIKFRDKRNELLGVLATYFLSPYSASHSLIIFIALLSSYYPRFSIVIWLLLWVYQIITKWSTFIQMITFR